MSVNQQVDTTELKRGGLLGEATSIIPFMIQGGERRQVELPDVCVRLIRELESLAVPVGYWIGSDPTLNIGQKASCVISDTEPKLFVEREDDHSAIFHELLHLKRYFIDRIPLLAPCPMVSWYADIDQKYEHAFVIPEQVRTFGEARGFWESDLRQEIGRNRFRYRQEVHDPESRCKHELFAGFYFAFATRADLPGIQAASSHYLDEVNCGDKAERLLQILSESGKAKLADMQAISAIFGHPILNETRWWQTTRF